MPLKLRPNTESAPTRQGTDHHVMSGELCVGRIYKREAASNPTSQWLWAINGVQHAGPKVMRLAGMTASLDQAKAELKENWDKWLVWAKLQEISDHTPPAPLAEPPHTPVSSI